MVDRSAAREQPLALVVGACGGMGLACARRLGQQFKLVLADINAKQLEVDAAQLAQEGISVVTAQCDVTCDNSVASLMEIVAGEGVLQACAHVVGLSPIAGDWRRIMEVNLQGAARIAGAAQAEMENGVAIFISSLAAHGISDLDLVYGLLDAPLAEGFLDSLHSALEGEIDPQSSYRISKYALNRMCRRLAFEWGLKGNRIVSLSPGLIATPMGAREFDNSPAKWELLKRTPLQRQGGLQEIADALEFLVSSKASFITGTDLLIDGGIAAAVEFNS